MGTRTAADLGATVGPVLIFKFHPPNSRSSAMQHCLRPGYPGGIELEQLESAISQYQQAGAAGTRDTVSGRVLLAVEMPIIACMADFTLPQVVGGMEGLMQWKSQGNSWQFMAVLLQDCAIQLHDPPKEPGATGNLQVRYRFICSNLPWQAF